MPVCFKFVDKSTSQDMTLDEVDREACRSSNFPYSKESYCPLYQYATLIAVNPNVLNSDGIVDNVKLTLYLDREYPDWKEWEKARVRYLLTEKYQVSVWYQRY